MIQINYEPQRCVKDKMEKKKTEYEEINAYPSIGMLSDIEIEGKNTPIRIGGWSIGGFYLEEPYVLKEEKSKSLFERNLTYYKVIKDKKLQSEREKQIKKLKEKKRIKDIEYYKKSIKESKELIKNCTKELKKFGGKTHNNSA